MEKSDGVKYAPFKLTDLFTLELSAGDNQAQKLLDGDIPLVSTLNVNNGICKYISEGDGVSDIYPAEILTVDMFGQAYYQNKDFYAVSHGHVNMLRPKFMMTEMIGLYIAAVIESGFHQKYGFMQMCTQKVLKTETITLPVDTNGVPNWQYMDGYMREIEAAACKALSLCDAAKNAQPEKHATIGWKQFQIKELFQKCELDCRKTDFNKATDISTEQTDEFSLPLVNAMHFNNGIMYYGREEDWDSEEMTLDIVADGAASTGDVYAQPQKTGILYNAYLVKPYAKISAWTLQYLATVVQKCVKDRFGYDNKCTWNKVKEEYISLPVDGSGSPDWQYMENYMRNMEQRAHKTIDCLMNA